MNNASTVSFYTLGCKLNFAETSTIGRTLKDAGFSKVEFEFGAEVVVINTCSVTENADRECRTIVKKALQYNPGSFIAIIGCYAQLKPKEIALIPGVDLVLGATEKFNITEYLDSFSKKDQTEIHSCEVTDANSFVSSYSIGDRTRAFLKVQDGCDYTCSYCTIPLARGSSRSDSIANIVAQSNSIAKSGVKEIVLTGVNIGDFGIDLKKEGERSEDFLSLIESLDAIQGIERFRISSIEPNLLKDEIIQFVARSKKFVPHFHIPLQSGSNKILGLMRRRYQRELYAGRVERIKELMPDACIGVDVIVGFPGETEVDFLETYNFLNGLDISYLHVFTYSERDNTDAIQLRPLVPVPMRKQRNKMLRILSEKKYRAFCEKFSGKQLPVLFENESADGYNHGFTHNYIKVRTQFDPLLRNKLIQCTLGSPDSSPFVTVEVDQVSAL